MPSMFASSSLPVHLLRGGGAIAAFVGAVALFGAFPTIAGAAASGGMMLAAIMLLRGCPMCWLIGLFETIGHAMPEPPGGADDIARAARGEVQL